MADLTKPPSGVYSPLTENARVISEEYWRKKIAEEISIANSIDQAIQIINKEGIPCTIVEGWQD
jgi:hypothetical protein